MKKRLLLLAALLMGVLASHGALPLKSLREMQKKAPEKVTIEVTDVDRKATKAGGIHGFDFTVTADVKSVTESAAGLKKGDVLEITYWRPNLKRVRMAGDWPEEVKEGDTYLAFLSVEDKAKRRYKPAASSGSFDPVKP